ncbi:unnamed protein product [Polarella glacialis]|uniref:HEAT repeat domain-containing protein n=1 Tax=Polarella glacialis TaxID=89957 RepID=A0A813KAZ3_POLGL|nr:unnamed protein product [Polarella glacialis]
MPSNGVSLVGETRADKITYLLHTTSSPDPHVRQAACQSLSQAALRTDPRVAAALICRLQDRDLYVRQAAAGALAQATRRGDEQVLEALVGRLADSDAAVRRISANALAQVTDRGCALVIAGLLGRLEDKDGGVRRSAVKALEKARRRQGGHQGPHSPVWPHGRRRGFRATHRR